MLRRPATAPSRRSRWTVYVGCALGALLVGSAMVWQSTDAAFSRTTSNGTNSFAAGSVILTNGRPTSAAFSTAGVMPSTTYTSCIVVTYTGSLDASVKLYGASYAGDIGTYLNFAVDQGTGTAADCSDFASPVSIYSGTLADFATNRTGFSTGVGSWTPTGGSNAAKTYRFTYSLNSSSSAAQNRTGSINLTWEAQNT